MTFSRLNFYAPPNIKRLLVECEVNKNQFAFIYTASILRRLCMPCEYMGLWTTSAGHPWGYIYIGFILCRAYYSDLHFSKNRKRSKQWKMPIWANVKRVERVLFSLNARFLCHTFCVPVVKCKVSQSFIKIKIRTHIYLTPIRRRQPNIPKGVVFQAGVCLLSEFFVVVHVWSMVIARQFPGLNSPALFIRLVLDTGNTHLI